MRVIMTYSTIQCKPSDPPVAPNTKALRAPQASRSYTPSGAITTTALDLLLRGRLCRHSPEHKRLQGS